MYRPCLRSLLFTRIFGRSRLHPLLAFAADPATQGRRVCAVEPSDLYFLWLKAGLIRAPLPEHSSPTTIPQPLGAGESLFLYRPRVRTGLASRDRSDPLAV